MKRLLLLALLFVMAPAAGKTAFELEIRCKFYGVYAWGVAHYRQAGADEKYILNQLRRETVTWVEGISLAQLEHEARLVLREKRAPNMAEDQAVRRCLAALGEFGAPL